ncbi:MAG: anaerobic ribonucleoside-triphosphate reductase activating protein [Patescibacteria group bacterium]|nr:anaerobic ribonucleoside-triphosphate reductase activating protein [Patescibacteria group bacterium]
MQIAGIQKTTLVDYPGKVAATIFTRGCSFRCGFCHNPELVIPEKFSGILFDEGELFSFLETRVGKLEAICITGGEPTIQPDINEFIRKVKKMGFLVKLDTNGSRPERLKEAIDSGNVDYIAMDIKSSPSKYELTAGVKVIVENVRKSIDMIINSGIDYEFRTTVCHPLHEVEDFEEMGKLIKGAKRYYIQNFVESKQIDEKVNYEPFTDEELELAKNIMEKFVEKVEAR